MTDHHQGPCPECEPIRTRTQCRIQADQAINNLQHKDTTHATDVMLAAATAQALATMALDPERPA